MKLTHSQFHMGILGQGDYICNTCKPAYGACPKCTRLRYVISHALSERASERRREGRPDIAGRLSWLAGQLEVGNAPTKRVIGKLTKDLAVIEERLVAR